MDAGSNKRHKVSPNPSRKLHYPFSREIRTVKVTKFLPNSSPQGDFYNNLIPNQKNNPNTNAKTNAKKDNLHQDVAGPFVTFIRGVHLISCLSEQK